MGADTPLRGSEEGVVRVTKGRRRKEKKSFIRLYTYEDAPRPHNPRREEFWEAKREDEAAVVGFIDSATHPVADYTGTARHQLGPRGALSSDVQLLSVPHALLSNLALYAICIYT